MTLQIHVQINDHPIHVVEARRASHLDTLVPHPDAVLTYDVALHHHTDLGTHEAGGTSVEHRWGDGELALAAKALDALALAPTPRPVVLT